MEIVLILVAVLVVGGALLPALLRRGARDSGRTDVDAVQPSNRMPAPGGPAPTHHGRPVPGSGPDRARHGKP